MQTGKTALAWAARKGHNNVVHILLNAKANPDIQDQVNLHMWSCVSLLLYMCMCVCIPFTEIRFA